MKKRMISALLALMLCLCLCACNMPDWIPDWMYELLPQPTPTPTLAVEAEPEPTPTPTPEPTDALGRWLWRADNRYNMRYEDFTGYWCLMCDEYFGDDMHDLLTLISSCENTSFKLDEENGKITEKRNEYKKLGGSDWSFEITSHTEEALGSTACANFSDELQRLNELISAVTAESETWSDSRWSSFAESLGCELDSAKAIIDCYRAIADKCSDVYVVSAQAIELTVSFSDGTLLTDSTTLYEIDGEYVCTELIDSAALLIQLIYF